MFEPLSLRRAESRSFRSRRCPGPDEFTENQRPVGRSCRVIEDFERCAFEEPLTDCGDANGSNIRSADRTLPSVTLFEADTADRTMNEPRGSDDRMNKSARPEQLFALPTCIDHLANFRQLFWTGDVDLCHENDLRVRTNGAEHVVYAVSVNPAGSVRPIAPLIGFDDNHHAIGIEDGSGHGFPLRNAADYAQMTIALATPTHDGDAVTPT